jgi:hypothetical protein
VRRALLVVYHRGRLVSADLANGTYRLVDAKGRVKAHRGEYGLTLEEIRRYLTSR